MEKRGYRHHTPLNEKFVTGECEQTEFVTPYKEQVELLRKKCCGCRV